MKTKKISDEVLAGQFEAYYYEVCKQNSAIVSLPEFGKYLREKGYDIQDHTIRRRPISKTIREMQKDVQPVNKPASAIVFVPLDVDAFLQAHNSAQKLKEALGTRDQYYSAVTDRCSEAMKQNDELKSSMKKLTEEVTEKENEIASLKEKLSQKVTDITRLNARIKELSNYVKSTVNPAIANQLLVADHDAIVVANEQPGILKEDIEVFTGKEDTIHFDSAVQNLFDNFINS